MRSSRPALLIPIFLVGCAAPDPVVVDTGTIAEPSIRILFPVSDDPIEPVEIALDEDCMLTQLVVVDIDNFELVAPNTSEVRDGEGHVHVAFEGDYDAVNSESFTYERRVTANSPLAAVGTQELSVTLQGNDHSDLDQFKNWKSTVEYKVVDPFDCL